MQCKGQACLGLQLLAYHCMALHVILLPLYANERNLVQGRGSNFCEDWCLANT